MPVAPDPAAAHTGETDVDEEASDEVVGFETLVLEAIERVNRELGTSTAVITHNSIVSGMADRVIQIADGRIASRKQV